MKRKEMKQYALIIIAVLFVSVVGFTSAFFLGGQFSSGTIDVEVGIEESSFLSFLQTGDLNVYADVDNFAPDGDNLSQSIVKSAVLKGTEGYSAKYSMYLNIEINTFKYTTDSKEPELIISMYDVNNDPVTTLGDLVYVTKNGVSGFDVTEVMFSSYTIDEDIEITIPVGETSISHDYTYELTLINLDSLQDENSGKVFNADIIFVEEATDYGYIHNTIFDNYDTDYKELLLQVDPEFNTVPDAGDKSIHLVNDDYKDDSGFESVYFRGSVDDNWVYFGGFYWRIIRIDGAGNIRMIYSGTTAPDASQSVVMTGTGTQIGTSYFNSSTTINAHLVGYMYNASQTHGLTTNSTIKTYVDNWYKNNLLGTDDEKYIYDAVYCGDRAVYNVNNDISYYRTESNTTGFGIKSLSDMAIFTSGVIINSAANAVDSPQYIDDISCYYDIDKYSVDAEYGNGALTYPVGLITGFEAALTGLKIGAWATSFDISNIYLYTNQDYFTMSPNAATSSVSVQAVLTDKLLVAYVAHSTLSSTSNYGVRPVITLDAGALKSGGGTWDEPFVIEKN